MAFRWSQSNNNSTTPLPYLACLFPGTSKETQQNLRFVSNTVLLPLNMALNFMSLTANFLLLIAVARIKVRQHPSLILLCSLSSSDLIWTVLSFYINTNAIVHIHNCPSSGAEEIYLSIWYIFATLSNLTFISKDRFRAVRKPLWYHNHMTKSRALKEAISSWLISLTTVITIYVIIVYLPEKFAFIKNVIALIFCSVSVFIIISSYIGIHFAMRTHRRKNCPQVGSRSSAVLLNREKRLAVTVGLILMMLILLILPALISPVALILMGFKRLAPFRVFITIFITFNGMLNPLINFRRNEAIRQSIRKIFACTRRSYEGRG